MRKARIVLPTCHEAENVRRLIPELFSRAKARTSFFLSTREYSFQTSLICELLRNRARPNEVPCDAFEPRVLQAP